MCQKKGNRDFVDFSLEEQAIRLAQNLSRDMMFKGHILILKLSAFAFLLGTLTSCANIGPRSINASRTAYAEAIDQTENEQLLLMVVKGRYGETASLLAVNAVASNIKFRSEGGIDTGFGPQSIRGDNKVFGRLAYEENPTITYSPVQGRKYLRQLESPIPLDLLLLTIRNPTFGKPTMLLLISRANDLLNPDFLAKDSHEDGKKFIRFVDIFTELQDVDVLTLVKSPLEELTANILISDYAAKYGEEVKELMTLLDLPAPEDPDQTIIIPIYFGLNFDQPMGLGITTRTTLELIEILRATIDVPEEHIKSGLALSYPPLGPIGEGVVIKVSQKRPENSSLAVFYRDYWFYIDETDQKTKAFFNALRTLSSIVIDDSIDARGVPLMTIPVAQ
ncbi:MAG: hypothetical protein P8Y91_05295 [Desulfuromonadales bacterium]